MENEYEERIARLEQEIKRQEGEIAAIKAQLQMPQGYAPNRTPQFHMAQPPNMVQQPNVAQQNFAPQYAPNNMPPQKPTPKNLEKQLGDFMGVIASVLVFIGMILFGLIVYVMLTDVLKAVCILTFSVAILVAGTVMMNKKQNAFTMSVAGCGIGAVFLSLLIIHIYFGLINRIVLYVLIAVWAALVYWFFGKRSYVFKVIGQIGVTIAVLFGTFAFGLTSYEDGSSAWNAQYIMLWVFQIGISLFYLMARNEWGIKNNLPFILLDYIAAWSLAWTGMYTYDGVEQYAIAVALILYWSVLLYWYVFSAERYSKTQQQSMIYIMISVLSCMMANGVIGSLGLESRGVGSFLWKIAVLAIACGAELMRRKLRKSCDDKYIYMITTIALYVLLLIDSMSFKLMMTYTGVGLYGFLTLAVAYRTKSKTTLWLSYATMVLFALTGCEYGLVMIMMYLLYAAVSGYMAVRTADMYDTICKCGWYLVMLLLFLCCYPWVRHSMGIGLDEGSALEYIIAAAINCVAVHWLDRSRKEDPVFYMLGGINISLLFFGIVFLVIDYNWLLELLVLIAVVGVCFSCIPAMYRRYSQFIWCNVYTGFKLTIFMLFIIKSFALAGIWVSIGWLALAVSFIVTGFVWNQRYLRQFGMFLAMFAVVKLTLWDIHYGNLLVRAGSFLVCGGLCFAINMIYNKFDKKL